MTFDLTIEDLLVRPLPTAEGVHEACTPNAPVSIYEREVA